MIKPALYQSRVGGRHHLLCRVVLPNTRLAQSPKTSWGNCCQWPSPENGKIAAVLLTDYCLKPPKMKFLLIFFLPIFFSQSFANAKEIVPIELNRQIPYVSLKINGQIIKFILDSGARTSLYLTPQVADSIKDLKYTGKINKSIDLAGKERESKEFIIPQMIINGMRFSNLKGEIFSPWGLFFSDDGQKGPDHNTSVIGMDFFAEKKLLINFSSQTLKISEGEGEIVDDLNAWTSMPFDKAGEGYVLSIPAGNKSYRMILDTAATISIIKSSALDKDAVIDKCDINLGPEQACQSTKLSPLGLHSLQPFIVNLPDEFKADGILGNDFFSKFSIFLDLKNKLFYVKPENLQIP